MKLPDSVQEIADVIGVERALFLIGRLPKRYGYRDERYPAATKSILVLYVPTLDRLKPNSDLVKTLGWADAEKMSMVFGGEILHPANCMSIYRGFRDQQITRLLVEGVPVQMVAEWFGVGDRHVKNIGKEIPQQEMTAANDNTAPIRKHGVRKTNGLARFGKPAS